ncbi:MAG: CRTAC1 family protein, partial [Planctomycetota bacterium]
SFIQRDCGISDDAYGCGVAIGDVNADGFPDLLVCNLGTNGLWLNNGDGSFSESPLPHLTATANGMTNNQDASSDRHWTSTAAIADLNGDHLPDIYCVGYCSAANALSNPCFNQAGNRYRACGPVFLDAETDYVLINDGRGGFIRQAAGDPREPLLENRAGRGLSVLLADLDQRPGLEAFVSNDQSVNHLWQFDGLDPSDANAVAMSDVAAIRGVAVGDSGAAQACMGIAAFDLEHDGDLDFIVSNYSDESNNVFLQSAPGQFRDQSRLDGMRNASWSSVGFGIALRDFDRDGARELLIANGRVNADDEDATTVDAFAQRPLLLQRDSYQHWKPAAVDSDYLSGNHIGRSIAVADIDRNGTLDVGITHLSRPFELLRTEPADDQSVMRSVTLRLIGTTGCRDATGARIAIQTDQQQRYLHAVAGGNYFSASTSLQSITIPMRETIRSLRVRWPDGKVQTIAGQPELDALRGHEVLIGQDGVVFAVGRYGEPERRRGGAG